MIPLSSANSPSAISGGLTWSKLAWNRGSELRLNGEIVGSLHKSGFWSSSFVAETQSGNWMFRRSGCLGNSAEILDSDSQQKIADFKSTWGNGAVTFADGQTFQVRVEGWWRPVWSVLGDGGEIVLRLHRREKTVELPAATALPDSRLLLLIMFTWYQVLKAEEDAASAVVVAAVS
jgi:hypothetical protein